MNDEASLKKYIVNPDPSNLDWANRELKALTVRKFYGNVTFIIENGIIQRLTQLESKKP